MKYYIIVPVLVLVFLVGISLLLVMAPDGEPVTQPIIAPTIVVPESILELPPKPEVVIPKEIPVTPSTKEFTIQGDDDNLFPDSILVNKGDIVKITFVVKNSNVYFGGLDFRAGPWGDTGKLLKGSRKTVEFVADKSFEFKSYWPASNKLKATGNVVVN